MIELLYVIFHYYTLKNYLKLQVLPGYFCLNQRFLATLFVYKVLKLFSYSFLQIIIFTLIKKFTYKILKIKLIKNNSCEIKQV